MAEGQAQGSPRWELLHFRDAIWFNDTVRTGDASKAKVLLRDDSIMALAEHSELHFTAFLLAPQQRRTIVTLTVGTLRVITERFFGAGSLTEVHTPNTVIGVRGTTFVVRFIPPATTEVISLEGVVTVRNRAPTTPELQPIPPNFRTQVVGNAPPGRAVAVSPATLQELTRAVQLTEHIPGAVLPSAQQPPLTSTRDSMRAPPPVAVVPIPLPIPVPFRAPQAPLPPGVMREQPAPERGMLPPARAITPETSMRLRGP
jgi:ferric-dicitrate binding protein FerR (iron transport regulator)